MIKNINTKAIIFLSFLGFLFSCAISPKQDAIFLSGTWQFQLDSLDAGVREKWFETTLPEELFLPGSMKENAKGFTPGLQTQWTGSIYDSSWFYNPGLEKFRTASPPKFPFWLTPDLQYLGPAWYQKKVDIPTAWIEKQILLYLERPHWETTIWVDGNYIVNQNSLSTPHIADLTGYLSPGEHTISIRVDNRLDEVNVGPDSHSVSDHTQGNWNGIIGEMKLIPNSKLNILDIQLYPNPAQKLVKAKIVIENNVGYRGKAHITVSAKSLHPAKKHKVKDVNLEFYLSNQKDTLIVDLPMGDNFLSWDEFTPNLYSFNAKLSANGIYDSQEEQFGMREIKTHDKQILINNRPVFLRGNVDCCVFPLTGYPPTDIESWEKVFSVLKSYGLNHVRFHSWCPPEAAFIAADHLGLYLQPEGPSWTNHGVSLGNGLPIDNYIYEETKKIFESYGNHPSFCMFAYGNEPIGNYVAYLEEYLKYWKKEDDRRIYTGASIGGSWKECQENQYQVKGGARGLPWKTKPNSSFDFEKQIERFDTPFITHELGQYCVFPDFSEIPKYTGNFKSYNFELFRELLENNHMGDQANDFLMASGELQKRCYKYEMEASLRTYGMTGYQLLGLNDFPGQGTALVGVLNAFYESKGYIDPSWFQEFCGPVTLLATLPKFVYHSREIFTAGIEIANYGMHEINDQKINWEITNDNDRIIAKGVLVAEKLAVGDVVKLGEVSFELNSITEATKLTLKSRMGKIANHWDFWVYPESLALLSDDLYVTDILDKRAEEILNSGGNVLLLAAGKVENGKDVIQHFTPVFWNTSWFKMRPPHTTGILIQEDHPVFKFFPTEYHSDMQWWEILNRQQVMNLENFPYDFRPLIQPIDTWFLSRRLGLLWEAKAANGKIIVCSADIQNGGIERPVARQLLYSIKKYMNSSEFQPEQIIPLETIHELFEKKDREEVSLYSKNSPDELKPKH